MNSAKYSECDLKSITDQVSTSDLILIITATPTETEATHSLMKPLNLQNAILKVFVKSQTYYFGILGKYKVVHVQSSMGSVSKGSSIITTSTAIELFKVRVVVMIGIAFGVDEVSQRIGDVLVSESIRPYDSKRVGEKETISRAIETPASGILLGRFKSILLTWEHLLADQKKAKLIFTRLLSGEELIDNIVHRDQLLEKYPGSKGGEMEGTGLATACDSFADWIVVKGICDFADGNKGSDKDLRQLIAINAALSACLEVFSSNHSFAEFGIYPNELISESKTKQNLNIEDVLFEVYDKTKESFYIIREEDSNFISKLQRYGIWIFGPPGCGKSNLILRNLIQGDGEFIQINLTGCNTSKAFLEEILFELDDYFEGGKLIAKPKDIRGLINSIIGLLNKHAKNRKLVLLIEEIPLSAERKSEDLIEQLYSLIVRKGRIQGLENFKVVLSSLIDPRIFLREDQQKIHSYLFFSEFKYWDNETAAKLINLIEGTIGIKLDQDINFALITTSKGSPRFIKKFFKNLATYKSVSFEEQLFLVKEVDLELNHRMQ